jgi:hypothetical protein
MNSREKTNTDAYETETICPTTEVKILKYTSGKRVTVIHRVEKPGRFKHKPFSRSDIPWPFMSFVSNTTMKQDE